MAVFSPDALHRFFRELKAGAPAADAEKMILSGIAVAKNGYHDSRENNQRNDPGNYSIQLPVDSQGHPQHAAAIDITFSDAQRSDFRTIAKYSKRLLDAYRAKDPRLFFNGERIWREFFGNADLDREVEGWSLYHGRAASSDSSHLYHIHQSVHRKFADNFEAQRGALDILLGRPLVLPKPPEDLSMADVQAILAKLDAMDTYNHQLYASLNGAIQTFERRDVTRDAAVLNGLAAVMEKLGGLDSELDTVRTALAAIDAQVEPDEEEPPATSPTA